MLVGVLTRNILLTFARQGFFRPQWSGSTIDEEFARAFARIHPGGADEGLRQKARIEAAFPEARTADDAGRIAALDLPDPGDRHVLAAAIQAKAAVIVTNNLRDFPRDRLAPFGIEARSADGFIADCLDLYGPEAIAALRTMRERFGKPALDAEALVRRIEQVGLGETAILLEPYVPLP